MGFSTDFVGHIDIEPRLNDAEIEYLTAFFQSRRCLRNGDPYEVPGNPRAESSEEIGELYNIRAPGQPNLWCDWTVCWDGCCLAWNGTEKSYSMIPWLRYLIAHFLKPKARASRDDRFESFTVDHQLSGMVVGCRRDTKELFAVTVRNNRVTERVLRSGDPSYYDFPPLPYEEEVDRARARSRRRRRASADTVVSISERRSVPRSPGPGDVSA